MSSQFTVMITGANRGIGLTFVQHYLAKGATVLACCRHPAEAHELRNSGQNSQGKLEVYTLDVSDPESIELLAEKLSDRTLDLLINNAGIYGPKGTEFGDIEQQSWLEVLNINTVAPLLITQALYQQVARSKSKIIAYVSSKMGSIADNQSGGSYIYRSSKAGLNAVVKSLSHDLKVYGIKCVALHPGWVKTDMGGSNALISTQESVAGMTKVLDTLNDTVNGKLINYDGTVIPW
jgi:NAD(P)-dependent dehydrogenase (short-subunit alcohol dehydrogenase family)